MRTWLKAGLCVAAGLALVIGGCSKKKAETPKDAMVLMAESLTKGDKDQFMAVVDISDENREVVDAQFDLMAEMLKFAKAMEAEYGESGDKTMASQMAKLVEQAGKADIKITGDKATATAPGGGPPQKLVKKDGYWYVVLELPPGQKPEDFVKMARKMAKAFKELTGKVGTISKKEMNAEVMKAVFGIAGSAPRSQ